MIKNKKMKKIHIHYISLFFAIIFFSCSIEEKIDSINDKYFKIPDNNFEKILIAKGIDSDGVVNQQILKSDVVDVVKLDLTTLEFGTIADLSGIEEFKSLRKLIANQHDIEQIDLSANNLLEEIHLSGNYLSSIDISKNTNIVQLNLSANQLTTIIGLPELIKLKDLDLSFNYFTELCIDNESLEILHFSNNDLISLDISTALNITNILLTTNKLNYLDISLNKKIQTLLVSNNHLQSINLSENTSLTHLYITSNILTDLDVSNNLKLVDLRVDRNPDLNCIKVSANQNIPNVSLSNYQSLNTTCN